MYFNSILICGGDEKSKEQKLEEIYGQIGVENKINNQNIIRLTSDDEKSSLGIEKVRELHSFLSIKSTNNQPKVAIIPEAENLTEESQNALLKTLEEPPENVYLILFAKNLDKLLSTVVSRCQVIELSQNVSLEISPKQTKELNLVLKWIGEGTIENGFAWAKENTNRKEAIETLDKLLFLAHQRLLQDQVLQSPPIQAILKAKKYISTNTSVRLTLENLFLA